MNIKLQKNQIGNYSLYAYEEELLGTAGAIKNAGKYVTGQAVFCPEWRYILSDGFR